MLLTQLHFIPIGFGHAVCANKVYMVMVTDTAQSRRILKEAKEEGRYIETTKRRGVKSLILMDDNRVIGCAFHPETVLRRLFSACTDLQMTEEEKAEQGEEEE